MFDPPGQQVVDDVMPEQREFLDRYFVDTGYHKDLIQLIVEECPVPPSVMSNRELDRKILDLLPGHVAPVVKATDKQWQTLDKRLTGSMGHGPNFGRHSSRPAGQPRQFKLMTTKCVDWLNKLSFSWVRPTNLLHIHVDSTSWHALSGKTRRLMTSLTRTHRCFK